MYDLVAFKAHNDTVTSLQLQTSRHHQLTLLTSGPDKTVKVNATGREVRTKHAQALYGDIYDLSGVMQVWTLGLDAERSVRLDNIKEPEDYTELP